MNQMRPQQPVDPASGRSLTKTIYNLKLGQAVIFLFVLAIFLYLFNYIGALPDASPFFALFTDHPSQLWQTRF